MSTSKLKICEKKLSQFEGKKDSGLKFYNPLRQKSPKRSRKSKVLSSSSKSKKSSLKRCQKSLSSMIRKAKANYRKFKKCEKTSVEELEEAENQLKTELKNFRKYA